MATYVGLPWTTIGSVIAFGLIAYVLFEFPVGYLADNYLGEKEMMAAGFAIMSLGIASVSFIATVNPLPWMAVMFALRIGASLIETTVESYFFKHTKGNDTNYLSFFRLTRPLGFVAGGLIGSASLVFLPFPLIFIVLALVILSGVMFASQLRDTR
jgi:MFS family permease